MEDMMGKTLKLREDLTLVTIEEMASLLDVEKRCCFDPNDTASFLLKLMEDGCLYENLTAMLISEFDVAEETAQADIDDFLEELLRTGLLNTLEAITRDIVREPQESRKPYQTPRLQPVPVLVAEGIAPPTQK